MVPPSILHAWEDTYLCLPIIRCFLLWGREYRIPHKRGFQYFYDIPRKWRSSFYSHHYKSRTLLLLLRSLNARASKISNLTEVPAGSGSREWIGFDLHNPISNRDFRFSVTLDSIALEELTNGEQAEVWRISAK